MSCLGPNDAFLAGDEQMITVRFHWISFIFLVLLVGCSGQRGPVIGDWRGYQPLATPQGQVAIELVLYGRSKERCGKLRVSSQTRWTEANAVDVSAYLDGTWVIKDMVAQGRTWRNIIVGAPGMSFPTYVLLEGDELVPALDDGSPDMSDAGWGCCRLAPVPKNSFGYGRV